MIITYTATFNNDATTAVNVAETNTATFEYSNYPYVQDSHKTDTATAQVITYGIQVTKVDSGDETKKLQGATFDLYRAATELEIQNGQAVMIPHTEIQGVRLLTEIKTGADGIAKFDKLEAGTAFYLVETGALAGYQLMAEAKVITINTEEAAFHPDTGYYAVTITNATGIQIPVTGGMGTGIFTAIGLLLMGAAAVLFVLGRKKQTV